MDRQKFQEYLKTQKKERRILTLPNILILLLLVIAGAVWYHFVANYLIASPDDKIFPPNARLIKVVFFDVGQGDASLITTPDGKNIMIDAGSTKGATIQESEEGTLITEIDSAREVIIPYLRRNRITRLDAIIVTHPHVDHFGGFLEILDIPDIEIGLFVDNGLAVSNPYYEDLLKKVRARRIPYWTPRLNDLILPVKFSPGDDIEIKFLLPVTMFDSSDDANINNSSLVARLRYKNFTALFTGDIETAAELEILNWKTELRSSILKVPHHGSQTSSSLPFLDMTAPQVAVISCGRGNPYGHPHSVTIERLNRLGIKTLRTDESGTLIFTSDGIKFIWDTDTKDGRK